MNRKVVCLLIFAIACPFCTSILARDQTARDRLFAAHALYYTPTASGLQSFQCVATIDWKVMLTRITGTDIPEDNPILKYLRGVQLSVVDQLKSKGSMKWTDTGVPPEGKEEGVKQIRGGLQQMMGGFFQSWNAYMNGSMVPYPNNSVTVTKAESGIHLHGSSPNTQIDEDFDKNMLLTQVVVESSDIKVVALPTYVRTDDGLVISVVTSQVNQPPSAPPAEVTFRVEYTKVGSFQLPSRIVYGIKNVGEFEFALNACQVSVDESAQKPADEKSGNPTN